MFMGYSIFIIYLINKGIKIVFIHNRGVRFEGFMWIKKKITKKNFFLDYIQAFNYN